MANAEQLSILKRGVEVWNAWRAKNIYVYTDLNEADLNGADLQKADLRIAHLRRANLFRADLRGVNLSGADLSDANLREANLSEANLTKANLNGGNLSSAFVRDANLSQANLLAANLRNASFRNAALVDANLMVANLARADFSGANLSGSNLTKADLSGIGLRRADLSGARLTRAKLTQSNLLEARFIGADLTGANVSRAVVGSTVFANSDLGKVIGLETTDHRGPSHISTDTILLSAGKIPEVFLRGCGLSDVDVAYAKLSDADLGMEEIRNILRKIHDLRAAQTRQVCPLFICFSHANGQFVDKMGRKLEEKGIRYWREDHERVVGWREGQIDRAACQNPKVLLVLSEHSIKNDWLESEINEAIKREKETGHGVLYLVALDERWKDGRGPKPVIEQLREYNILDFSAWRNNSLFDDMLRRLIEELDLFPKG